MNAIITYGKKEKRNRIMLHIVIVLLLLLWIPVSIDKISDFEAFKNGILRQPFSDGLGYFLIYLLPALEILIAIALVTEKFRTAGLIASTLLMAVFTGYIEVALLGAWGELPCGCGSVIRGMNWTQHFFFNLLFLLISGWGFYLQHKLQSSAAGCGVAEGGSAKRQIKLFFNNKIFKTMKKLKVNLLMVAALAIGAVTMSFKMADTTTQWRYIGTAAPYNDVSKWEQGAGSGCSSSGTKPCELNVDAADESELNDFFTTVSSTQVYNMSSKKN